MLVCSSGCGAAENPDPAQSSESIVQESQPEAETLVFTENITGSAMSRIACSITGVAGRRVENVTLRNVTLDFPGGGVASDTLVPVPEVEELAVQLRIFIRLILR